MDSPTDALRRSLQRLRAVQRRLQGLEDRLPPRTQERVQAPLARGLDLYEADLPPAPPAVTGFERRGGSPPRWARLRRWGRRLRGVATVAQGNEAGPSEPPPEEAPTERARE